MHKKKKKKKRQKTQKKKKGKNLLGSQTQIAVHHTNLIHLDRKQIKHEFCSTLRQPKEKKK